MQTLLGFLTSWVEVQWYRRKLAFSFKYKVPTFLDRRVRESEELLASLRRYYGERMCLPT